MRKKAFTLIELLVVIAIISLLVSILLPSLTQAKRLAKMTVCKSGLRNAAMAMTLYTEDNDGNYPTATMHNNPMQGRLTEFFGNELRDNGFIENAQDFLCPASRWAEPSWTWYQFGIPLKDFLRRPDGYYQSYLYFGNYSWDTKIHGVAALFSAEDVERINAGLIYPRDNSCARAKLLQDTVINEAGSNDYTITNHESPNSAFTDGSVEQGPVDPYELDPYGRVHGQVFYW